MAPRTNLGYPTKGLLWSLFLFLSVCLSFCLSAAWLLSLARSISLSLSLSLSLSHTHQHSLSLARPLSFVLMTAAPPLVVRAHAPFLLARLPGTIKGNALRRNGHVGGGDRIHPENARKSG